MLQIAAIVLGTLISEDLACIAAGVLAAQGRLSFLTAVLASLAGIVIGDILLFVAGRYAGTRILGYEFVQKRLPPEKIKLASEWLGRHGDKVIILSRFTPGMRLPVYVTAGILKAKTGRMIVLFTIAAVLWTPVLVGAAAVFGRQVIEHTLGLLRGSVLIVVLVVAAGWALRNAASLVIDRNRFLMMRGAVLRRVRWEFLPAWVAYVPVAVYIVYLAIKHRSALLFTAANPGIFSGGLTGESKSAILEHLAPSGRVPRFAVIEPAAVAFRSVRAVLDFMHTQGLDFPIVLKPDVGERGEAVGIVRSIQECVEYFHANTAATVVQEYVPGIEFGIFYARTPEEPHGRILSITCKEFPVVQGDGRRSIEELILNDDRAVCIAGTYLRQLGAAAARIPAFGERVQLVEIGSHCRGAIFLNAMHLWTETLDMEIDRISRTHPGFYFGRFDVRCDSIADLQAGNIQVIELNGVAGEPAHVYDPAVSLAEAYRVMFRHWSLAFEIGAIVRNRGVRPMRVRELIALLRSRAGRRQCESIPVSLETRSISSGVR